MRPNREKVRFVAKADFHTRPSGAVKSADRVLTLLEYLAEVKRAPFADIVRDLGLPNSSCHQLLHTVGLDERTVAGLTRDDAVGLLTEHWSRPLQWHQGQGSGTLTSGPPRGTTKGE